MTEVQKAVAQEKYRPISSVPAAEGREPGPECTLAAPIHRNVAAYRLLQIRSSYYSEQERLAFVQEMRLEDEFVLHRIPQTKRMRNDKGEEVDVETGAVLCVLKKPDLMRFEFLLEVARLLFVGLPKDLKEHQDYVNYQEIERGKEAFEGFFERRSR